MNEKKFFHNALESDLLSGSKQKRRLDAALGRTTAKASVQTRTTEKSKGGMPRWVYIPAVAVLLVLTLALGSVVIARGLRNEQHQAGQPTADHTPVEAPKQVVLSNSAEIRLLSEIDATQQFTETREGFSALPAYNEADWGWLKEMTVRVNDLSATASSISWKTELRISKRDHAENPFLTLADVTYGMPLCFFYAGSGLDTPDTGAQLVEYMLPGEIVYTEDDDNWIVLIPEVCAMPQVYDQFPAALPPAGEVTIKNKLFVLDREAAAISMDYLTFTLSNGETEEYPVSLLGTIEHTFTFDAEALLNIAEPVHIDVPLSGEYVLSIHENNGFHNERVDLSGVTLDAEIHYTVEGVVVVLSIKDAAGLSDVEQEALYLALSGGPTDGGPIGFDAVPTAGDIRSSCQVWRLSRAFWGTTRFARYLIAIDPSAYAKAETLRCTVSATYAAGKAGDEPRDDWSWTAKDMEGGKMPEINYVSAPLASFEIPLPEVDDTQTNTPIPEPTAPQDDKVAICVYFYDGGAEDAINERFKAQYPELYNAYLHTEWSEATQVQQAIEARRQVAAAYYSELNRERCLKLCDEEDFLFLSSYSAMSIIRVPYEKFSEIRSAPGVTHIEIYEETTSATSDTDPMPVTWSAALSKLLETEASETAVSIQFYFTFGSALEDAFLYDGKTLTEYRNQPELRAYGEAYEGWFYTEYRELDAQNRGTPGWEKHDPAELFDTYWRERHNEAEIRAYEQAFEARKKALNAFSEWRDGEAGQKALRTISQQECDRLNALGFSLHVTENNQLEGTATVQQLLDFPAKDGCHYWISLLGDESPIDE